ncbi:hypothetical protein GEMMAAP_03215 [Gemmatimonas phototrophica]|uniref:BIG2 domain-containing protein n=2 Tax=Gemmatimonas phototrophica TaxID=1379270 RepID=A0A143BGE8_9BACT|nr:hypothetical protein GEMMAAP_03215 [Gemmatimonas phototrophica]
MFTTMKFSGSRVVAAPCSRAVGVRVLPRVITMLGFALLTACGGGGDATGPGTGGGGPPVTPVASRIDLSASAVGLGAVGASENVTALVRDGSGNLLSSATVSWSSADITVADVSGSGNTATITARAPGRTTIRATSGAVTQDLAVTVSIIRGITLPASSQVRAGGSMILTPTLDAEQGAATALRWESADPTIANVASGVVTGVSLGTTTIRVSAIGDSRITATTALTVTGPRSVVISNVPEELFLGEDRQFTAVVDVDGNESRAIEWSSGAPSVATVTSSGRVIAIGLGTAIIRVQSTAFTNMKDSVVLQVRVPRFVTVSPSSSTMGLGQTRQLSAQVQAEEGFPSAVSWRSSNPSVAMVASSGLVTAVSQGTATVTAVLNADTTRRGTATINIVPLVRDVEVQPSAVSIAAGDTRQLGVTLTGDPGASQEVTWRTGNPAVATVSATGLVTGVAAGTTMITAVSVSDTTRQSTSLITVRNAPTVTMTPTSLTIEPGEVAYLGASVQADAGVNTSVTWRTSDAAVVTVSGAGQITGIALGSATITAVSVADTTRRASSAITVSSAPGVRSLSVSPAAISLQSSQTVQLVPTVQVTGGASAGVTYRSDNPSVASVNFTGLVTAMANGSATITVASTADPSKTATAAITVSATPTQLATAWTASRLGGALHEDVVSFDGIDANSAFAVNSKGDVFRMVGGVWSLATRGTTFSTQFLAVSATGVSAAVAVGTNGVIARFDGTAWSAMSSGVTQTLNGVHLDGPTSGFAVGAGGVALRLNGGSWSSTTTGSTQTLNSVWVAGSVAVAVGTSGEVLRWNGSTWTRQTSGTSETLYGVTGISGSDVVAVGTFGTVLRFNGTSWSTVNGGNVTADLYSVSGSTANSNRYYIASDNGLYSLNNNSVQLVTTPYAPRLFGTSIDASGNVWTSGQRGSVMRLSGTTWETVNLAPDLIDAWSTATSNAWAVGEFGFIYRWNGSTWSRQSTPTTTTLNAVWGTSTTEAFAGGDDGTMLRWNGSSWTAMSFPSTGSVYGLWGSASNSVYAVTSSGEVLRFNGTSWSIVATSSSALWVVYGSSANDVYAAGENGTTLRFNGTSWNTMNAPTAGTMAGIWSAGPATVLSVGANSSGTGGIAYRHNGTTWSAMSMPVSSVLTSVWGANQNDVYATGETGTILRWNGTSWSSMTSGSTDLLWAVTGAPAGNGGGFAVGYNSTVVAATSTGGFGVAGYRALTTARGMELDPRAGAKLVRGALPTGKARKHRRGR